MLWGIGLPVNVQKSSNRQLDVHFVVRMRNAYVGTLGQRIR